ncbi:MAG: hypothetical protein N3E52_04850 [Candidatus Bathyarchaeota archaeon]|nr:hypothetical protein [Candidatus Bathyarchaeota archaeon]
MTDELKFSSAEIKSWLEDQTRPILAPVHAQAQKLRDDMREAIQSVTEASKLLFDSSTKEIEKRNMRVYNRARALNKLSRLFLDRLKKVNVPDYVSYENLNKLAQETQKVFLVTDIDVRNWFPRLSPFFIMDRRKFLTVYEKAKLSLTALNDFLSKEYVKTKTLEDALQLVDELRGLERQLVAIEAERKSIVDERLVLEKELAELERRIADLKSRGPIDQLFIVETEIGALNNEITRALRHLQKPFRKVQAMATQGGGAGLTLEEQNALARYLEKPFEALATEDTGYPLLKQILQKLSRLISEGKLKLKPDKAKKAEQSINEILHDSLRALQQRCVVMATQQRQILNSAKMAEIRASLAEYQEQAKQLKARKISVEAHEAIKERAYRETQEKIDSIKRAIEKNILGSLGVKIQIL